MFKEGLIFAFDKTAWYKFIFQPARFLHFNFVFLLNSF